MRKSLFGAVPMVIVFSVLVASAYAASVTVVTTITQDFYVVFTFSDVNATVYGSVRSIMTANTVPMALDNSMAPKGQLGVNYNNQSISFDNDTHSIVSAFTLQGTSIINSSIDRAAKIETFRMNTAWRKFYLNVTTNFSFNFTQNFAQPLSSWKNDTSGGATSYSYSNSTSEGVLSCSFQLPNYASDIAVSGDIITFDAPYNASFADNFISSPILILIALAVAGVIVYIYRKI